MPLVYCMSLWMCNWYRACDRYVMGRVKDPLQSGKALLQNHERPGAPSIMMTKGRLRFD